MNYENKKKNQKEIEIANERNTNRKRNYKETSQFKIKIIYTFRITIHHQTIKIKII